MNKHSSEETNQNSFLRGVFVIGAGTAINMVLGLLSAPIITRIVDPNELGQLNMFNTYGGLALMVLCLGLDQALVRFFYDKSDLNYKSSLLTFCICSALATALIAGIGFVLLKWTGIIKIKFDLIICLLLVLYVFLLIWDRYALLVLRLTYDSKTFSICNIVKKLFYVVFALSWLKLVRKDYLLGLCIAMMLPVLLANIIGTISARNVWRLRSTVTLNHRKLIKYSLPLIFAMGLSQLFEAIDRLSLDHYCTYTDVGIYSSAISIVNIFAIIQTAFTSLWAPTQIEHYTKNPEDKQFYQRANQLLTVVLFFVGINLIFFKDVFALLLGTKYRFAAHIMPFLVFHPIFYTISETTHIGIGFAKKSHLVIIISLVSCMINFIGNTILVPRIGSVGAAISTGLSYSVFFALRTVFSNKYYYVDYRIIQLCAVTVCLIALAFQSTFYNFNIWTVVLYILCLGTLYFCYKDYIIQIYFIVVDYAKRKTKRKE